MRPAPPPPDAAAVDRAISAALAEDFAGDDVTTRWSVDEHAQGCAELIAKSDGVIAGIDIAAEVFKRVDPALKVVIVRPDGSRVRRPDVVAEISGPLRSLLSAERTALNLLQRMSGIATLTTAFVERVAGTRAKIFDTRKTAPGLRALDKYAVAVGGGQNHRMHLSAMVLLKENHIRAAGGVEPAVQRVRAGMEREQRAVKIDVEVETLAEFQTALALDVDWIMLDNMSLDDMRTAVRAVRERGKDTPVLEASGNVSLETVRAIAETGVDLISVGSLTHSVSALDLSLLVR